ncbi:phage head-tail connector protein [Enterococcus sp.]|uniref:phage head-tail connector protein n=1 Tax=Enterococcus sp. TaxID=35783 RepID=UPI00289C5F62|nr:phage head-tail connector protein [Enterococcus sp.]
MHKKNQEIIDQLAKELARKFNITDEKELGILKDDIKDAMYDALDYCNRDLLIGHMISSVKDLYIFRVNTEGVEGSVSRSEGSVSQTFEIGIPAKIKSKLNRYRLASVSSLR